MTGDIFVGRQQELQRLCEAFDAAREGRGGLVMITGEPGIGKTRLARELEGYASEHGARVLWDVRTRRAAPHRAGRGRRPSAS